MESWVYTMVLTYVVGVAGTNNIFCCWETNERGGDTVYYCVNKQFEDVG